MLHRYILILAMLLPVGVSAMEWPSASWLWESDELLSVGKSHVSLTHQSRSADQRLNQNGDPEFMGRSSRQRSERDGRTFIREFKVKIDYERWTPSWAYGLSRNWTFMAQLPLTKIKSNISESIRAEGNVRVDASALTEARQSMKADTGVQIAEAGEYSNTRVGRFELRSKHRVYAKKSITATMFETLKFPTLEKTQVDFVAYPDPLPRNFGAGLGFLMSARMTRQLGLVLSSQYLYQFEDEVYGRKDDGMPTEDLVSRKPGAEVLSKLGAEFNPSEHLNLSTGYSFQSKDADEYFSNDVQETQAAKKHSVYVNLAYLPGLHTTKRQGQSGFSAALGYESLLSGENVEDSDTVSVEMQMTF